MKENGEIKSWDDIKNEFKLEQGLYFKWMQLVNAKPSNWKNNLRLSDTNSPNLILLDHHLVKSNSLFSIEKLESGELYWIMNSSRNNRPTSQIYFEKKFDSKELEWRVIYTLLRKVTTNTYLRSFQYKVLNNVLYLNEKLFDFGLSTTSSSPSAILFVKISHIFSLIVQ